MAKVDVTEIDRDFLAVTGLWSELMHILGHFITIHMPSAWMVYGDQSAAFQEGRQLTRVKASNPFMFMATSGPMMSWTSPPEQKFPPLGRNTTAFTSSA